MRLSGKWFARGKLKASFTTISLICYYILNLRTSTISLTTYVQLKKIYIQQVNKNWKLQNVTMLIA